MSEYNDQDKKGRENKVDGQDNRDVVEKKQRRFDLKLISIIIIGSSIIFGILIYRRVKTIIKNPPNYGQTNTSILHKRKGMNAREREQHYQKHKDAIAVAARREGVKLHGKPLVPPRPINHFPNRKLPVVIDSSRLTLLPLSRGVKSRFQEVQNLVAIDKKYSEQFDAADIFDSKMGKIFVPKNKVIKGQEQSRVSYNQRTKQLGVITGKMILKFSSPSSFDQRQKFYPSGAIEQSAFPSTQLVIVNLTTDPSFNDLLELEQKLSQHAEIKRVKVDILEHGNEPH